jgi:hypothetical protein
MRPAGKEIDIVDFMIFPCVEDDCQCLPPFVPEYLRDKKEGFEQEKYEYMPRFGTYLGKKCVLYEVNSKVRVLPSKKARDRRILRLDRPVTFHGAI